MRTFNPQLRNKNRERAIRPRVVTCVLLWLPVDMMGGSPEGAEWLLSLHRRALLLLSWLCFVLLTAPLCCEGRTPTRAALASSIYSFVPKVKNNKKSKQPQECSYHFTFLTNIFNKIKKILLSTKFVFFFTSLQLGPFYIRHQTPSPSVMS